MYDKAAKFPLAMHIAQPTNQEAFVSSFNVSLLSNFSTHDWFLQHINKFFEITLSKKLCSYVATVRQYYLQN